MKTKYQYQEKEGVRTRAYNEAKERGENLDDQDDGKEWNYFVADTGKDTRVELHRFGVFPENSYWGFFIFLKMDPIPVYESIKRYDTKDECIRDFEKADADESYLTAIARASELTEEERTRIVEAVRKNKPG